MEDINKNQSLNKLSENTGTCYGKNFKNVFHGFFSQFQDSFFYANVIQFIIVALMYFKIGRGRYWNVLFYASLSGVLGALLENLTVAYICSDGEKTNNSRVYSFIISEIFWTSCQYSVPLLNLIKMKAFSNGTLASIVKYTILGLCLPFVYFRFTIGFKRMSRGYLVDEEINSYHGYAFGILAIADFICTLSILYFVRMHNKQLTHNVSNFSGYIKNSSYTILVAVDIVGFSLSILDIITTNEFMEDYIPSTITIPFQCVMSNFILILASDALLFKFGFKTKYKIYKGQFI
ncbi:hypothetical protein H8356DRAFT_1305662 [Neocallimastix lanati (nom. inval.)]|nr:hypothetical protein H8356DRAFT_1305662 [Neocallimastix sp. JGI-2020a]